MKQNLKMKGMMGCMLVGLLAILSVACSNEGKDTPPVSTEELRASNDFKNEVSQQLPDLFSADISPENDALSVRSLNSLGLSANKKVYVEMAYAKSIQEAGLTKVSSLNDVGHLITEEAANFSFEPTDYTVDSFELSEIKANEALQPLIQASKTYLYSLNFSEWEIQDMLAECGGMECDLVLLVLGLVTVNEEDDQEYQLAPFVPAGILPIDENETVSPLLNWNDVLDCAMEAIGADVFYALAASKPNVACVWTKKAIKKLITGVAKRFLGPAGVILAVGEFGYCLYRHR